MRADGPKERTSAVYPNINCATAISQRLHNVIPAGLSRCLRRSFTRLRALWTSKPNHPAVQRSRWPQLLLASGNSISFMTSARPHGHIWKFWHTASGAVYVSIIISTHICGSCTLLRAFGPHKLLIKIMWSNLSPPHVGAVGSIQ